MKVREMIEALRGLPQDADMGIIYDGGDYLNAAHVWLARGTGRVLVAGPDEPVYDDENRPEWAPSEEEDRIWHTDR